jgi:hypothetical protein
VSAIADGLRAGETAVTIAEGETKSVDLVFEPDPDARLTPIVAPAAVAGANADAAATPSAAGAATTEDQGPTPADEKPGWLKYTPYAAFGVGAIGIGLGTIFGLKSASSRSDADDLDAELRADCGSRCRTTDPRTREINTLDEDARGAQTLSIVGFIVGGVGVAGGVVLLVLDPGGEKPTSGLTVTPRVGLGSVGVSGVF